MNKTTFLILVLFGIILLQHCKRNTVTITKDKIVRVDSIVERIKYVDKITKTPTQIKYIPAPFEKWDTVYLPSQNKDSLRLQYINVTSKYLAKSVFSDSVYLKDSFGLSGIVKVIDTVQYNTIINRHYSVKLDYPKVTKTITIKEPIKRALYIGAGIQGNQLTPINQVSVGLMFKNKKDNLIGIQSSISNTGVVSYGINSYFKIRLR